VGSTNEFRAKMAHHMIFGTALQRNLEQAASGSHHFLGAFDDETSEEDLHEAQWLIKLQGDLYFSGEPIYDYAFWIANNHLMLGIIFHHPMSPLDTGHRFVIMILTSFLIVFPVALVSVLWKRFVPSYVIAQGVFRLVFMALIVIVPRNILKARMKNIAIQHEEMYIDMRFTHGNKTDVHKIKKDLIRQEALLYGGICFITAFFCWLTWLLVSNKHEPLTLVLDNTDGLGFCFVLEFVFALILPRDAKSGERMCLGWWGRWRSERLFHEEIMSSLSKRRKWANKLDVKLAVEAAEFDSAAAFVEPREEVEPAKDSKVIKARELVVTDATHPPLLAEPARNSKVIKAREPVGPDATHPSLLAKSRAASLRAVSDTSSLLADWERRSMKFVSHVPTEVAQLGA